MRYGFERVELDTDSFTIYRNGEPVSVEPQVFDLILFLIENRSQVMTRAEIFDAVWHDKVVSDSSLSNHIKTARNVLGDSADKQAIIKTCRGRGYQFVAALDQHSRFQRRDSDKWLMTRNRLFAVIVFLVILIIALFVAFRDDSQANKVTASNAPSHPVTAGHLSIAVLPLVNQSKKPEDNYLGLALANEITGEMAYLSEISVRPLKTSRRIGSEMSTRDIGEQLKVSYLLTGGYKKKDGRLNVVATLVDIKNGRLLWRFSKTIRGSETAQLPQILVADMAKKLQLSTSIAQSRVHQRHPNNSAHNFYLLALAAPLEKNGHLKAVALLQQAVDEDPSFANAHSELGRRLNYLAAIGENTRVYRERAESHLLKSLALNPHSLKTLSGLVMFYTDTGKTMQALIYARQILAINPKHAYAFFSMGYVYRYVGLLKKSVRMMDRAISLDTGNREFRSAGLTYLSVGKFQQAFAALELDAGSPYSMVMAASIYNHMGQPARSVEMLEKIATIPHSQYVATEANLYKAILLNKQEEAEQAMQQLEDTDIRDVEIIYFRSILYAGMGKHKKSIELLREAINGGYWNTALMRREPLLQDIRQRDDFKELLQRADQRKIAFGELLQQAGFK